MARKYIQNCTGDRAKEKNSETNKLAARLTFWVLAVFFVGAAAWVLLFSGQMQITAITVAGTQELHVGDITQKIQQSLQGKYLKIIPKNNFLFVSDGNLENILKNQYKKIRAVSVTKNFPDALTINIDERKGLLVWCKGDNDCFLLDENGVAYSRADFNSPEITENHLLQITDISSVDVAIGDQVMDSDYEKYFLAIKDGVKSLGIAVQDQYYTPSRMAQEIQAQTTSGVELYFSTQFSLDSAVKTLGIVLKKEIPADQLGNLAYIDLRTENKVFYKLNNQPPSPESPPSGGAAQSNATNVTKK